MINAKEPKQLNNLAYYNSYWSKKRFGYEESLKKHCITFQRPPVFHLMVVSKFCDYTVHFHSTSYQGFFPVISGGLVRIPSELLHIVHAL